MTRGAALCVALVVVAGAAPGNAAAAVSDGEVLPSTVLLLAGRGSEPLAGRLAAELTSVGIEVQREEPADDSAPDPVAAALRVRARAAVWVPPGAAAAEVWIIDRGAGRSTIRQSITAEGDGMAPLVALRTVEFLRASLLGMPRVPGPAGARGQRGAAGGGAAAAGTQPATAAAAASGAAGAAGEREASGGGARDGEQSGVLVRPAEPPPEPWPRGHGPRFTVALGGGAIASPGGIGLVPSISAVVRAPLYGRLGAEALGLLSVVPAHTGELSFTASMAGGGLSLRLLGGRRATLDAGAGAMAVLIRAAAQSSPYATLGALYGRLGGGVAFTPWLGVRAEALIGGTLERVRLKRMGDTSDAPDVVNWGRPFGAGMLNLEARWM